MTDKPYQPISEASKTTGISQYFIRCGVKAGTIPYVKTGKKVLINVPAFLQMMDEQSRHSADNPGGAADSASSGIFAS